MPEAGTRHRTVVCQEPEGAVGHFRTRDQAWSAHNTSRHWRRHRGGVEGVVHIGGGCPELRGGDFFVVFVAFWFGNEPAETGDAAGHPGEHREFGQAGSGEHDAGNHEEDHTGDGQVEDEADAAYPHNHGPHCEFEQVVQAEGHAAAHEGGHERPNACSSHLLGAEVP